MQESAQHDFRIGTKTIFTRVVYNLQHKQMIRLHSFIDNSLSVLSDCNVTAAVWCRNNKIVYIIQH